MNPLPTARRLALALLLTACAGAPEPASPPLAGQAPNGAYGPTLDADTMRRRVSPAASAGTTAVCGLALAASGELERAGEALRFCLAVPAPSLTERCLTALLHTQLYGEIDTPPIDLRPIVVSQLPSGAWGEPAPSVLTTTLALLALRQGEGIGLPLDQAVVDRARETPIDDRMFRAMRADFIEAPLTLEHALAALAARAWQSAESMRVLDALLRRAAKPTPDDDALGPYGEAVRILILCSADSPMPLFPRFDPAGPARGRILLVAKRPTWRVRRLAAVLRQYHDARIEIGTSVPAFDPRDFDLLIADGHPVAGSIDLSDGPSGWDPAYWNRRIADALGERPAAATWIRTDRDTYVLGAEVTIEAHGPDAVVVVGPDDARAPVDLRPSPRVEGRFVGTFLPVRVGLYRIVHADAREPAVFRVDLP